MTTSSRHRARKAGHQLELNLDFSVTGVTMIAAVISENPRSSCCAIDDCEKPCYVRGFCNAHYLRWKRHGDPLGGGPVRVAPSDPVCTIDGCDKPVSARGWCSAHWERWSRHGDPLGSARKKTEVRFWTKVSFDGPTAPHMSSPCWLWLAGKNPAGYGQFGIASGSKLAHRIAFELATGEKLGVQVVDHICHVAACVRPDHLRPCTRKQNAENVRGARRNSSSGVLGVSWDKQYRRWAARVHHNGKRVRVGYFDTIEEAGEAARLKRLELFTHNDIDRMAV